MTHNPFVSLLEEFRSAAATLNTTGFAFTAWWHFPQRFVNAKRRVLGLCCLPVQYGDEVQYQEFTLTVATAGAHAKCGPVFADLASRAGAALFPEIRSELAEQVPLYISQMEPWWFAFLWRVFVGTEPLQHPVCADTGKPAEEPVPLPLARPFLLSIDAIELCKLHTDQPVFPPPPSVDERDRSTPADHGAQQGHVPPKPPSDKAWQAWRVRTLLGINNQTEIAKMMTQQGSPATQGQVSRWLQEVDDFLRAGGIAPKLDALPADDTADGKPDSFDPAILDMGPRQGGEAHRVRQQRLRRDPDSADE